MYQQQRLAIGEIARHYRPNASDSEAPRCDGPHDGQAPLATQTWGLVPGERSRRPQGSSRGLHAVPKATIALCEACHAAVRAATR